MLDFSLGKNFWKYRIGTLVHDFITMALYIGISVWVLAGVQHRMQVDFAVGAADLGFGKLWRQLHDGSGAFVSRLLQGLAWNVTETI